MSLECSECEHDLRGPHGEGCSYNFPEIPACAAVRILSGSMRGVLISGKNHAECVSYIAKIWPDRYVSREDGFMTTRGRFVNREVAFRLFRNAGRISASGTTNHNGWLLPNGELDSGDLYQ